jgi:hypothetical protein
VSGFSVIGVGFSVVGVGFSVVGVGFSVVGVGVGVEVGVGVGVGVAQLFVIDLEWLSVGRIRFGFYAYGRIQYCHQVTNVNNLTGPYTTYINLPICYTIHNTVVGSTIVNAFTQICSTVISEGGYTPLGRPFAISSSAPVQLAANVEEPILFLRGNILNTNYYHQNIIPTSLSMICTNTNNLILYKLVLFSFISL